MVRLNELIDGDWVDGVETMAILGLGIVPSSDYEYIDGEILLSDFVADALVHSYFMTDEYPVEISVMDVFSRIIEVELRRRKSIKKKLAE